MKSSASLERRLNRHATTILIGGIFFTFSVILFLSFCHMPCEDPTYALLHADLKDAQSKSFWGGNPLSPHRSISCFMYVTVLSAPKNSHQRDVIRETWGKDLSKDIILQFVIGTGKLSHEENEALKREKTLHEDVLLLNFNDSFDALTSKVMETFKWVDRNVHFKYLQYICKQYAIKILQYGLLIS